MPLKKTCCCCKQAKLLSDFYANKRMKDGRNTFCISCHKADNIARKTKNRQQVDFRAAELAAKREYRERTIALRSAYMLAWRQENLEHTAAYGRDYRRANKGRYAFLCQKRKIDLMRRTPAWLDADDLWIMSEAYKLSALRTKITGVEWHVDHIVPLRGAKVSGLHVPSNLRVVIGVENQRKTNKYEV